MELKLDNWWVDQKESAKVLLMVEKTAWVKVVKKGMMTVEMMVFDLVYWLELSWVYLKDIELVVMMAETKVDRKDWKKEYQKPAKLVDCWVDKMDSWMVAQSGELLEKRLEVNMVVRMALS